jgi:serine phosphatase RsbU (regulator of sigma subunit)
LSSELTPRREATLTAQRDLVLPDRMQQLGILSRTPQRILSAHTEEQLRDALGSCLRGLFRRMAQYELFSKDEGGALVPVVNLGEGQLGAGLKLLASLKARLALRQEGHLLHSPQIFPSLLGVRRGSLMSAPLLDGSSLIGLIIVEGIPGSPDFSAVDLEVLEGIAALFSLALQRLRSKELASLTARLDRDLKNARQVQRQLMSQSLPPGSGVNAFAEYLPAFDVGGDFYDLAQMSDGKIAAVIGDVSGKGVTAALVMSRVSSECRRFMDPARDPAEVLQQVNRSMMREDSEFFVTASCVTLDPPTRKLRVASAGHVPLIMRRTTGEVFTFGAASGTPLGMLPTEYTDEEMLLEPGDIVLMMTDGLVEALDRPSDRMGMQLLLGLIKYAPHDPRVIVERSLEAVDKMKGEKLLDDVTLVTLQLEA